MTEINPEGLLVFGLAMMFLEEHRWEEAHDAAVRAAELPSMLPGFDRNRNTCAAMVCSALFDETADPKYLTEALAFVRRQVQTGVIPKWPMCSVLAATSYQAKDYALAERIAAEMARQNPGDIKMLRFKVVCAAYANDFPVALETAEEMLRLDPDCGEAVALRNVVLRKMDEYLQKQRGGAGPTPERTVKDPPGLPRSAFQEGFEEGLGQWEDHSVRNSAAGQSRLDLRVAHSGRRRCAFEHRGQDDWSRRAKARIAVEPGEALELSCWLRGEGAGTALFTCQGPGSQGRDQVAGDRRRLSTRDRRLARGPPAIYRSRGRGRPGADRVWQGAGDVLVRRPQDRARRSRKRAAGAVKTEAAASRIGLFGVAFAEAARTRCRYGPRRPFHCASSGPP